MILGLIYSDYNEIGIILSDLDYLFAFFIKLVGFFSFGLFFGILIKRSAFAVGAMVVWLIIESIIKGLLFWNFRSSDHMTENVNNIMQFFPFESMANLIKEPFSRLGAVKTVANQVGETFDKSYDVEFSSVAIVSIWTFLFIYWSYALLKKRDL